jgi:hypothetical protein
MSSRRLSDIVIADLNVYFTSRSDLSENQVNALKSHGMSYCIEEIWYTFCELPYRIITGFGSDV